jgi:UDP-GlcNAc:undecaprenyl-phosphate GlcNAc-1-phosphate transferase
MELLEAPSVAQPYLISAGLAILICRFAEPIGTACGLVDKPDGTRKLHARATPLVGGLALLLPSVVVSLPRLASAPGGYLLAAIVASYVTLLIGVIDDRIGVPPAWRLLSMMFVVFMALSAQPFFIVHYVRLHLMGLSLSGSLDPFGGPLTVLVILGFVNACNMADGMNGQLLGSLAIWSAFVAPHLDRADANAFLALIASTLVTFIFNLRERLFSGSSGSYAGPLFIAFGAITAYHGSHGTLSGEIPLLWFWLPVVDCIRLMATRLLAGRSPFSGDRNHFHHMLLAHMRVPGALPIYLVLLALPGVAAEFGGPQAFYTFLLCSSVYGGFIAWHMLGIDQVARAQTATYAHPRSAESRAWPGFASLRQQRQRQLPAKGAAH